MSLKYPHLYAFRVTEDENAIIADVIASYPGMAPGTALREFFTSSEVLEVIQRRSSAYRARQALLARDALRVVAGDDDEPDSTPSDPQLQPEPPAE